MLSMGRITALFMCPFYARYERQLLLIRNTVRHLVATEDPPEGLSRKTLSEEGRERIGKSPGLP